MPAFKFEGVTIEEAPKSAVPKCPKCEKRLDRIWVKIKGVGVIEQKQLLMCPHCESLLGYGTFAR